MTNTSAIIMHDGSTVGEVIRKVAKGNEQSALYFLQIASDLIGKSGNHVVASGRNAGAPSIIPNLIKDLYEVEDGHTSGMKFETFKSTYVKKAEAILRSIGCEADPIGAYNFLQDCHEEGSVTCWNLQTVAGQVRAMFEAKDDVEDVEDVADVEDVESVESMQDKLARLHVILAQLDADSLVMASHMVDDAQRVLAMIGESVSTAGESDSRIYDEAY